MTSPCSAHGWRPVVNKLERLTVHCWTHVGLTLEEIFEHYPSREYIVRRLLISGNDCEDVISADMTAVEQYRVHQVAQRITQLRHIAPNLTHRPASRKE